MLHFYSFLNLSSLNLILQWPLNLMGGESAKWLVCLSADLLVSWLIGLFHLPNSFMKGSVQNLDALGQDIGFHVLYTPHILTSVIRKYFYYHKTRSPCPITSAA